jgi:hypothetical protein
MSDHTTDLSAAEKAQISANLRLPGQFIRELVDKPEQHDVLPESGTIVLLPPDDPGDTKLSFANVEMAKQLILKGQNPILWAVGMPPRKGFQAIVRFPIVREDQLNIRYDRTQDVLAVAFSQSERPTMPLRHHPYVITLVDPETYVVVSYVIPNFLAVVAPKSLALFDVLFLSSTELIGITLEELIELRNTLAHGQPQRTKERMTASEILQELALLSA